MMLGEWEMDEGDGDEARKEDEGFISGNGRRCYLRWIGARASTRHLEQASSQGRVRLLSRVRASPTATNLLRPRRPMPSSPFLCPVLPPLSTVCEDHGDCEGGGGRGCSPSSNVRFMTRLPHRPTEHMRPISARRGLDGFEGLSHSSRRRGHAMACRQVARRWLLTSRSSHPNDHSSIVPHRVPESPDLGGPCNFPVHSPNAAAVRVQSGHDRRSSVSQAPIRTPQPGPS